MKQHETAGTAEENSVGSTLEFPSLLMLSGILNLAIMVVVTGSGRVPSLTMSPWSGQPSVMLQGVL